MPIEAPVTTTIFPASSIARFYSSATCEVKRCGYNQGRALVLRARFSQLNRALATGDRLDALLPLFPLDVVLFPGTPLPLHIFEPRYKEMIGECLAEHRIFGVVRAVEQGLAEVGCTAEIVTVVKEYPDGRLDLVTEGRKRFELCASTRNVPSCSAEVLMIERRTRNSARGRYLARSSVALRTAGYCRRQAGSFRRRSCIAFFLSRRLPAPRSGFQTEAAGAAL